MLVPIFLAWALAFDVTPMATMRTPAPAAHICDAPALDLDGDGALDRFETVEGSCGTGGCQYTVLAAKAPDRGVIDGCWFARAPEQHHGLFDILATWRLGTESETTRFRFDGKRYRPR